MNPNANLLAQEEILKNGGYPSELGELRLALTEWLRKGGFTPNWGAAPRARKWFSK